MDSFAPDVADSYQCPTCSEPWKSWTAHGNCVRCGHRAVVWDGIDDFLTDAAEVRTAAGGTIDLRTDRRLAEDLLRVESALSYEALAAKASRLLDTPKTARQCRADARHAKWYSKMEAEVGLRHGEAILAKLDAFLEERGAPVLRGVHALEAAGGTGRFLPGFSQRFDSVVFLDCSLVNIVLARKLVRESGLTNVRFVRSNVEQLPFRVGTFDFVHENNVIEHVADPAAMVREAVRVLTARGTYLCVSPNRFAMTPDPHFRLPLFGLIPASLRRALLPTVRGLSDEAGTDLRSLHQLRECFRQAGADPSIFFLPSKLRSTARSTPVRRFIKWALSLPGAGSTLAHVLNGPLLSVMPYHCAVVHREVGL
jgi:ubiquinone/menaquinone biosynthesis C-methylase UbiE